MAAEKKPFEIALKQLEKTITQLESDELTLDDALENFEKGVGLIRVCDEHLRNAEGRLRELLRGEDGSFIERVLGITLDSVLGGEAFDE
jgi:exodeoxyribonuclease VII small subunit